MNQPDIPVDALYQAAKRPEVVAAMRAFYGDADRRIAAHSPTCWNRGACCRLGEYGHRLYVTALEVAYYLAHRRQEQVPTVTGESCPHAHDGQCHARERRPLGCRIFYCDPAAQHWQGPLTEELLRRLRRLHDELNVPCFYADWLVVLRALQQRQ
ncbi:MAG: hypothetical protein HY718_19390 [Planctomycetes bacterium]|nr:hypothetical protein [Planctomycetota bacterium]